MQKIVSISLIGRSVLNSTTCPPTIRYVPEEEREDFYCLCPLKNDAPDVTLIFDGKT